MTCPHCGHLSSRFSEICTHCGAKIQVPTSSAQVPSRATHRQLVTLDARLLALTAVALTFGLFWGYSSVPPKVVEDPPVVIPVQPPAPVINIAPTVVPTPPASLSPRGITSSPSVSSRPSARSSIPLGSTPSDDTILNHLKDARTLKLINTHPLSDSIGLEVSNAYFQWKQAHSRSSFAALILSFYAPDAKIYVRPRELISRENLVLRASQAYEIGLNTGVEELAYPQWGQSADGSRVEVLATHKYSHDGGGWTSGQRRLIWQKRGTKWVIVRDDLPPLRVPEEQTPPTP